jgi:hypothetical protein
MDSSIVVFIEVANGWKADNSDQAQDQKEIVLGIRGNSIEFLVEGSHIALEGSEHEEGGEDAEDSVIEGQADAVTDHGKHRVGAFHIVILAALVENVQEECASGGTSEEGEISQRQGNETILHNEEVGKY